jgi:hypothetical protein
VGVRQPAKEFGQLAIFFWPSDKMPVVGKDTVSTNTQRKTLPGLKHNPLK